MKLALPEPRRVIWIAPGGGLEAGEDPETGLRRELLEETGLSDFRLGPEIWTRSHTFDVPGQRITQHERFWTVPTQWFEPSVDRMPEGTERDWFIEYRWWSVDRILASKEIFVPLCLGSLLQQFLEQGPPHNPIDVGL